MPGVVTFADKDFAMVLTDDGRRVVLAASDVDYRRIIADMGRKFPVGTRLNGAFEVDLADGATRYTLLPGQANPWPKLESNFPAGTELVGKVDSVVPGVGVFVHVGLGINGLVPEQKLGGRGVKPGDELPVAITALDGARRRISLRLNRALAMEPAADAGHPLRVGQTFDAEVVKVAPEGAGGYALVVPEGSAKTTMLHCTAMSSELRSDLNEGRLEVGDLLFVEVTRVDERRGKVNVKDRPDLDADSGDDPGAEGRVNPAA